MWNIFQTEALEKLLELEEALLDAESRGHNPENISSMYRAVHTFKGNARIMGLSNLESLAHQAEDLMGLVRDQNLDFDAEIAQILFLVLDHFRLLVQEVCEQKQDIELGSVQDLYTRLKEAVSYYQEMLSDSGFEASEANSEALEFDQDDMFRSIYLEMIHEDRPRLEQGLSAAQDGSESARDMCREILEGWRFATQNIGMNQLLPELDQTLESFNQHAFSEAQRHLDAFFEKIQNPEKIEDSSTDSKLEDPPSAKANSKTEKPASEQRFFEEMETEISLISEGIQHLLKAEPTDLDLLAEALANLKQAAEDLQYVRLVNICIPLKEALFEHEDKTPLKELEYQFFQELTAIYESLFSRFGDTIGNSPVEAVFEQWHAHHLLRHLQTLKELCEPLQDAAQFLPPEELTQMARILDSLQHACHFYTLPEAAEICLIIQDWVLRARQDKLKLPLHLFQTTLQFMHVLSDELESPDEQLLEKLAAFKATLQNLSFESESGPSVSDWIQALKLNPAFREVLSSENLHLLEACAKKKMHFYLLQLNLGRYPHLSEPFYQWLNDDLITPVTNITLYEHNTSAFQFLICSLLNLSEIHLGLSAFDPQRSILVEEITEAQQKQAESGATKKTTPAPGAAPVAQTHHALENNLLKVDINKVNRLMDLAGEIGLAAGGVLNHAELDNLNMTGFQIAAQNLMTLIRELQGETSSLRLVPVSVVFKRMERLIRDLKHTTHKNIELVISGESTEIDKMMADRLYDPLVHMIRNAVDHGIELPEERLKKGKPAAGRLHLNAVHQAGEVVISLSDDGQGLNRQAILTRARENGLIQADEEPEEAALFDLIFQPGFSTAKTLSQLSGRGVGMDVVKHTMTELRGRYMVKSEADKGTQISLYLPLTLAFIEGMIIEVGNTCYAIPIESIHEVFKVQMSQVTTLSTEKAEVIKVRNEFVPTCWLEKFYQSDAQCQLNADKVIVVTQSSRGNLAIPVDRLVGNQQVTLKPLSGLLKNIRAGAGYGLLSSGDVAIVLDCERLYAS
ncbi:hypothetical protein COW20_15105 [bacterium (Candidatus Blackallbacteria) CG13_big_fil_rev_8_21_14_2_50_49_14]|nr:MAG: hypothetical protein COW64_16465 [bacterium (Candidatus Blackallbacteria) CG18_big_fil_WC_8_21_14_2_50_49_26]PIW46666.1 MAG: hypothetical protein COW20_15105 [bacterium (Candidatus Blackallbacteria) CG13_big_fil_rev_8_21_14_2_50_49_14]